MKYNFIIDYTDYVVMKGYYVVMIIHSSMTTSMCKCKREIVITDYVDYPVLHITFTCRAIDNTFINDYVDMQM